MPISLKNVPLFQGLTESELDSIKDCLHEKSFAKGESLLAEGQACGRIFIVRLGRVKLYRNSGSGRIHDQHGLLHGIFRARNEIPEEPQGGSREGDEAG